jgi:cysteine synthase A
MGLTAVAQQWRVVIISIAALLLVTPPLLLFSKRRISSSEAEEEHHGDDDHSSSITAKGGYESLIGNTPLMYLPKLSSLLPNKVNIYVKMESMNPGGTGKDRAALSLILDAERRGELPQPLNNDNEQFDDKHDSRESCSNQSVCNNQKVSKHDEDKSSNYQLLSLPSSSIPISTHDTIPSNIHDAIVTALRNAHTHGILIEGTSGSTGISLASLATTRGHGIIVVMPDDQSTQKSDYLRRLGAGVVIVQNCSISNPEHYVNVAKRMCNWLQIERRYDQYYWNEVIPARRNSSSNHNTGGGYHQSPPPPPKLIKAAFMNQFENLANVQSHYMTTGPEIYKQLTGKVDAFVMSAGTGGTVVGVGGYLKEKWFCDQQQSSSSECSPPRIVLVDPPGSSLYNKVKFGVAYASQQSEQRLRRHRYDTLAEGIGLDRVTANFGLGCESIDWTATTNNTKAFGSCITDGLRSTSSITIEDTHQYHPSKTRRRLTNNKNHVTTLSSKIIDDAISITDQQAVYMAHYLLRHEGLFVGSSTAMNIVGALMVAMSMPITSNIVTIVCDNGARHTNRFWNQEFIVNEWGLKWPEGEDMTSNNILELLGLINNTNKSERQI